MLSLRRVLFGLMFLVVFFAADIVAAESGETYMIYIPMINMAEVTSAERNVMSSHIVNSEDGVRTDYSVDATYDAMHGTVDVVMRFMEQVDGNVTFSGLCEIQGNMNDNQIVLFISEVLSEASFSANCDMPNLAEGYSDEAISVAFDFEWTGNDPSFESFTTLNCAGDDPAILYGRERTAGDTLATALKYEVLVNETLLQGTTVGGSSLSSEVIREFEAPCN